MPIPQEVRDNPSDYYRSTDGTIKKYGGGVVYDPNAGSSSGGGDSGGNAMQASSPSFAPESFLSTTDFLTLAKLQAEASYPSFAPDIPALKDLAKSQVTPVYDISRQVYDTQSQLAQQQGQITRGQIVRNFDDAYDQLRESYNSRGLFFSGKEVDSEGRLLTSRAESLTTADLQLQELLNNISAKKAQLSLSEQKEIEEMFQTLLTSDESAYNKEKEAAINRIIGNMVPSFIESKGQLESYKLASEQQSRSISDALNLQTLDQRSQTYPLDLALKLAQVEKIPVDQAMSLANLAIKQADVNNIPIEQALKLANLELKQADVANIPLERQKLQLQVSNAMQNLSLGVGSSTTTNNLAEGLLLGMVTPERLYSSAGNTKIADNVLKTAFVLAQERVGQSFPYSTFEEELRNVTAGLGSDFLNIPAKEASDQTPIPAY